MCKNMIASAPRILVGLFFLVAGIMKLTIPGAEGFSNMINTNFGTGGMFGLVLS
jgi:uncharacterized membrane protein YphA (DoxX/SURF4 family)